MGSVLFGKKLEPSTGFFQSLGVPLAASCYATEQPERLPMAPAEAVEGHDSAGFEAPGTFVLALLLLVTFVVYYAYNFYYLSSVWQLG